VPSPLYPIIYVRGYAMTAGERDDTAADPFCGFNLGSTVYRANPEKKQPPKKFIFESPVVRLMSDFDYSDVYEGGVDIVDPEWSGTIPEASIVVYRYYDEGSNLFSDGKTSSIEDYANGLSDLVLRVRDLVCRHPGSTLTPATFRCYLVAHSMGGLVCRAFLQNLRIGSVQARQSVDKFFTYATPHNGIEMAGMNVPEWFHLNDMSNFNRTRMAEYLDLRAFYQVTDRVDWMPDGRFPSDRVFCLVGTNRSDYGTAMGLSRTFAGDGSDGLVRIANASAWGTTATGEVTQPCATAYVYRSHSGIFGIVNSEEGYQNLTRFLFGDMRADIWVDVDAVRLPAAIEGKAVDALYQFEALASPRGKRWYLTRRIAEEDSVACRTHRELTDPADTSKRHIYISTVFLANKAKVDPDRDSLAYSFTLGVRVPDYEVDRKFIPDAHYEGGYLFRDSIVIEITAPQDGAGWLVKYDWQSEKPGKATRELRVADVGNGKVELPIAFENPVKPGISGTIRFVVSLWNV
jgi:hypothetical protein